MKKKHYMLMIIREEGQDVMFFDTWRQVEKARQDAECGFGALAEVYQRVLKKDGGIVYEFMYS